MRNGVVIGCVGVVAATAVAIGVSLHPAAPAVTVTQPATRPAHSVRTVAAAPAKAAPRAVRPAAPVTAASDAALPAAFRILLSRTIFSPHAAVTKATAASESAIALRGIMQAGRGFVAFVENTASGEARQIEVGDPVGTGKITGIDLNSVVYLQGKRATRVAVGQTFDGQSSAITVSTLAPIHAMPD
jgi:hypothetical protein